MAKVNPDTLVDIEEAQTEILFHRDRLLNHLTGQGATVETTSIVATLNMVTDRWIARVREAVKEIKQ